MRPDRLIDRLIAAVARAGVFPSPPGLPEATYPWWTLSGVPGDGEAEPLKEDDADARQ